MCPRERISRLGACRVCCPQHKEVGATASLNDSLGGSSSKAGGRLRGWRLEKVRPGGGETQKMQIWLKLKIRKKRVKKKRPFMQKSIIDKI